MSGRSLQGYHFRGARVSLVAAVVGLCGSGCGRTGPDVQMVVGIVTLEGAPLPDATVGFSPIAAGHGLPATGCTLADGSFRLTATQGGAPEKGTTVGDYAVTVSKVELLPDPKWDNLKPGELPSGPRDMRYRYVIPKAYESAGNSGLKATVRRGFNGGSDFRFDLRSDYKSE